MIFNNNSSPLKYTACSVTSVLTVRELPKISRKLAPTTPLKARPARKPANTNQTAKNPMWMIAAGIGD